MKCLVRKNDSTQHGLFIVNLERNSSIIAIKDESYHVCNNCCEYYLVLEMTKEVLEKAEQSILKGVKIEVIRMTKVA